MAKNTNSKGGLSISPLPNDRKPLRRETPLISQNAEIHPEINVLAIKADRDGNLTGLEAGNHYYVVKKIEGKIEALPEAQIGKGLKRVGVIIKASVPTQNEAE